MRACEPTTSLFSSAFSIQSRLSSSCDAARRERREKHEQRSASFGIVCRFDDCGGKAGLPTSFGASFCSRSMTCTSRQHHYVSQPRHIISSRQASAAETSLTSRAMRSVVARSLASPEVHTPAQRRHDDRMKMSSSDRQHSPKCNGVTAGAQDASSGKQAQSSAGTADSHRKGPKPRPKMSPMNSCAQ
jgi:hypothetical protein